MYDFHRAQSSKLFVFESRVLESLESTRYLPRELAKYGKISSSKKDLNQLIGKLFVEQTEVNLFSSILDTVATSFHVISCYFMSCHIVYIIYSLFVFSCIYIYIYIYIILHELSLTYYMHYLLNTTWIVSYILHALSLTYYMHYLLNTTCIIS
jgi:hypothetical protein